MSKKGVSDESDSTLPEEVQSLIIRKLRQQRLEQEKLLVGAKQTAYSKLREEILANIRARKLGRAFISVPLEAHSDIVANVTNATIGWPGIVWETIKIILEKAQVIPRPLQATCYTPHNARREARKLNTQAMYESWQKEYRSLKKPPEYV